jgi:hypothetical protein
VVLDARRCIIRGARVEARQERGALSQLPHERGNQVGAKERGV